MLKENQYPLVFITFKRKAECDLLDAINKKWSVKNVAQFLYSESDGCTEKWFDLLCRIQHLIKINVIWFITIIERYLYMANVVKITLFSTKSNDQLLNLMPHKSLLGTQSLKHTRPDKFNT